MRTPNGSRQTHLVLDVLLEQPRAWRHGYELDQVAHIDDDREALHWAIGSARYRN